MGTHIRQNPKRRTFSVSGTVTTAIFQEYQELENTEKIVEKATSGSYDYSMDVTIIIPIMIAKTCQD